MFKANQPVFAPSAQVRTMVHKLLVIARSHGSKRLLPAEVLGIALRIAAKQLEHPSMAPLRGAPLDPIAMYHMCCRPAALAAPSPVTDFDELRARRAVQELFQRKCACCGKPFSTSGMEADESEDVTSVSAAGNGGDYGDGGSTVDGDDVFTDTCTEIDTTDLASEATYTEGDGDSEPDVAAVVDRGPNNNAAAAAGGGVGAGAAARAAAAAEEGQKVRRHSMCMHGSTTTPTMNSTSSAGGGGSSNAHSTARPPRHRRHSVAVTSVTNMVAGLMLGPRWRRSSVLSLPSLGSSSRLDTMAGDSRSSKSAGYKRWRNDRVASYCSRECQQQHWAAAHKNELKRLQERRDQGGGAAAAGEEGRDVFRSTSAGAVAGTDGAVDKGHCPAAAGGEEGRDLLLSTSAGAIAGGDGAVDRGQFRAAAAEEGEGEGATLQGKECEIAAAAVGEEEVDLPLSTSAAVIAA